MTENLVPLLEVTGALVRGCRDAARGVLVLAKSREYGGIVAAERSAWEMWNELEFLLDTEYPPDAAVKAQIWAVIDVLDLLEGTDYAPDSMIENHRDALTRFERDYPLLVQQVKRQRKKSKSHWSGGSRTSVVAPSKASKAAYKMLSWETHADILGIRDVSAEIRSETGILELSTPEDVDALVERAASSASECLLRAWNGFAHFWQQEAITNAPPRKAV